MGNRRIEATTSIAPRFARTSCTSTTSTRALCKVMMHSADHSERIWVHVFIAPAFNDDPCPPTMYFALRRNRAICLFISECTLATGNVHKNQNTCHPSLMLLVLASRSLHASRLLYTHMRNDQTSLSHVILPKILMMHPNRDTDVSHEALKEYRALACKDDTLMPQMAGTT